MFTDNAVKSDHYGARLVGWLVGYLCTVTKISNFQDFVRFQNLQNQNVLQDILSNFWFLYPLPYKMR